MPAIEFARGLESLECKRAEWSGAPRAPHTMLPSIEKMCEIYVAITNTIHNKLSSCRLPPYQTKYTTVLSPYPAL